MQLQQQSQLVTVSPTMNSSVVECKSSNLLEDEPQKIGPRIHVTSGRIIPFHLAVELYLFHFRPTARIWAEVTPGSRCPYSMSHGRGPGRLFGRIANGLEGGRVRPVLLRSRHRF